MEVQKSLLESSKLAHLNKLKLEISKCEKCELGLKEINKIKVSFKPNPLASILFIALNPSNKKLEGETNSSPFSNRYYENKRGKSGKLFYEMLDNNIIDEDYVCVANIVPCCTSDNSLKGVDLTKCDYIYKLIKILEPRVIVLLGSVPLDINKIDKKIKVLKVFHPSYILRNPTLITKYREQWRAIRIAYLGEEK